MNNQPQKNINIPFSGIRAGRGGGHAAYFSKPIEKARDTGSTMKKLWRYIRVQKSGFMLVFIFVSVTSLLNIAGPWLMKFAIDNYLADKIDYKGLSQVLVVMAAVQLAAAGFTLVQQWIMISVSQKTVENLRRDIFHKFQILTINFFDTRTTGELMSRVTNDIDNISNTLSGSFLEILTAVLGVITVSIVMVAINWRLALICLCIIPLVIILTKKVALHTRKGFRDRQKHLGDLNGIIEESITGQRVIKAFTKEKELLKTFDAKNRLMQKASNKANMISGLMGPLMNMMNNLNYAVTAIAGGVFAVYGLVSVGTIAAFLSYTRQFSRPLNHIAQLYTTIQSAIAGAERVFDILEEVPEFEDTEDSVPLTAVKGEVIFKDLFFSYHPDIPVIRGISINAEPGQTIALVGPTGAGKTTIINLLTGFYDFHSGTVTIDGKDIRSIKKQDLRRNLGIVLQETFLFSDTVKENIRYGRLNASDEEVIEAARLANAHQFIHRMPSGYDTEISEDGANLSQGQKQLIAIARAILSSPSILVLDEATSSVDTRTEIQIQNGMLELMKGRTSFVIAHRLSTIRNADSILVMDEGRIVEKGTHRELMDLQGFYYRLYNSQFGGGIPFT